MTDPATPPGAPPRRFRDRLHSLSVAALLSIPFVGHSVAEFYEKNITPRVTRPRDVVFDFIGRCFGRRKPAP